MRRLFVIFVLVAFSAGAAPPPEQWWDAYDRGVAAVNAKNYKLGAELLQKAIAVMPTEGLNVRAKKSLITYVPHFYLGIAKLGLNDPDGALREWKTCEEQGVVARTDYYAGMKAWIASAQTEKQRLAQVAASGPKKAASAALGKAFTAQLSAASTGGDRTASYIAANRKLQEANAQFGKAGTDVTAYKAAEQTANQAAAGFLAAAEEGKRLKEARTVKKPAAPPAAKPSTPVVQQAQMTTPVPAPVKVLETQPPPLATKETPAAMTPVLSEAEAAKVFAEREAKRKGQDSQKGKPVVEVAGRTAEPVSPEPSSPGPAKVDLKPAFRAFASGKLASSEQLLNGILKSQSAPAEAYLLRGCARYTQAMLSRKPDALLVAATDDFRAALERNRGLRLDRAAFSPKLVEFFENVRRKRR
ncbi:MAG TPA: hypothetical protein VEK57_15855 [Thermoanaerobaculia bacterium]|nr:hypothetical protein [Thermoanaerobaculia bacterium]